MSLLLAQYDADKRLIDVNCTEMEVKEGNAFHFQTAPAEIQKDTAYIKAFFWERDTLHSLRQPLVLKMKNSKNKR